MDNHQFFNDDNMVDEAYPPSIHTPEMTQDDITVEIIKPIQQLEHELLDQQDNNNNNNIHSNIDHDQMLASFTSGLNLNLNLDYFSQTNYASQTLGNNSSVINNNNNVFQPAPVNIDLGENNFGSNENVNLLGNQLSHNDGYNYLNFTTSSSSMDENEEEWIDTTEGYDLDEIYEDDDQQPKMKRQKRLRNKNSMDTNHVTDDIGRLDSEMEEKFIQLLDYLRDTTDSPHEKASKVKKFPNPKRPDNHGIPLQIRLQNAKETIEILNQRLGYEIYSTNDERLVGRVVNHQLDEKSEYTLIQVWPEFPIYSNGIWASLSGCSTQCTIFSAYLRELEVNLGLKLNLKSSKIKKPLSYVHGPSGPNGVIRDLYYINPQNPTERIDLTWIYSPLIRKGYISIKQLYHNEDEMNSLLPPITNMKPLFPENGHFQKKSVDFKLLLFLFPDEEDKKALDNALTDFMSTKDGIDLATACEKVKPSKRSLNRPTPKQIEDWKKERVARQAESNFTLQLNKSLSRLGNSDTKLSLKKRKILQLAQSTTTTCDEDDDDDDDDDATDDEEKVSRDNNRNNNSDNTNSGSKNPNSNSAVRKFFQKPVNSNNTSGEGNKQMPNNNESNTTTEKQQEEHQSEKQKQQQRTESSSSPSNNNKNRRKRTLEPESEDDDQDKDKNDQDAEKRQQSTAPKNNSTPSNQEKNNDNHDDDQEEAEDSNKEDDDEGSDDDGKQGRTSLRKKKSFSKKDKKSKKSKGKNHVANNNKNQVAAADDNRSKNKNMTATTTASKILEHFKRKGKNVTFHENLECNKNLDWTKLPLHPYYLTNHVIKDESLLKNRYCVSCNASIYCEKQNQLITRNMYTDEYEKYILQQTGFVCPKHPKNHVYCFNCLVTGVFIPQAEITHSLDLNKTFPMFCLGKYNIHYSYEGDSIPHPEHEEDDDDNEKTTTRSKKSKKQQDVTFIHDGCRDLKSEANCDYFFFPNYYMTIIDSWIHHNRKAVEHDVRRDFPNVKDEKQLKRLIKERSEAYKSDHIDPCRAVYLYQYSLQCSRVYNHFASVQCNQLLHFKNENDPSSSSGYVKCNRQTVYDRRTGPIDTNIVECTNLDCKSLICLKCREVPVYNQYLPKLMYQNSVVSFTESEILTFQSALLTNTYVQKICQVQQSEKLSLQQKEEEQRKLEDELKLKLEESNLQVSNIIDPIKKQQIIQKFKIDHQHCTSYLNFEYKKIHIQSLHGILQKEQKASSYDIYNQLKKRIEKIDTSDSNSDISQEVELDQDFKCKLVEALELVIKYCNYTTCTTCFRSNHYDDYFENNVLNYAIQVDNLDLRTLSLSQKQEYFKSIPIILSTQVNNCPCRASYCYLCSKIIPKTLEQKRSIKKFLSKHDHVINTLDTDNVPISYDASQVVHIDNGNTDSDPNNYQQVGILDTIVNQNLDKLLKDNNAGEGELKYINSCNHNNNAIYQQLSSPNKNNDSKSRKCPLFWHQLDHIMNNDKNIEDDDDEDNNSMEMENNNNQNQQNQELKGSSYASLTKWHNHLRKIHLMPLLSLIINSKKLSNYVNQNISPNYRQQLLHAMQSVQNMKKSSSTDQEEQ